MAYCTNCGMKNNEGSKFCTGCGKTFNTAEKDVIIEDKQKTDESLKINPKSNINDINMKKSINNLKGLKIGVIIVLLICICVGTVVVVRGYILKRNPVSRLFNGISKLSSSKTIYSTSNFKIKFDDNNKEEAKILEKMSLRVTKKADLEGKKSFYDLELLYNEQRLIRGKVYTDEKGVTVSIPVLCNENLYFGWNEINKIWKNNASSGIDFNKYKDVLMDNDSKKFKEVKNDYTKFSYEKLHPLFDNKGRELIEVNNENGTSSNIKCNKFSFNIEEKQFFNICNEFVSKMSDDKNLKALAKEKIYNLLDIVEKNNDYKKIDITKKDATDVRNDFDEDYNKFMNELKDELKDLEKDSENHTKITINSNMFFDSKDILRGVNNEIKIVGEDVLSFSIINTNVINSVNEKLSIDNISTVNVVNVGKMAEDEIDDLINEIQDSFSDVFYRILK